MAEIVAFRGIRYNQSLVKPEEVTSPPYDVISPADREYLHKLHPKNMVRLILGEVLPEDDTEHNRYTRASHWLDEWLADGTLVRDPKPAIYVYEQHYSIQGQEKTVRGFVCLVKLHDYADNVVLPHENTLAKPKSHLAPLIRATNANLDSVYSLYPDKEGIVDAVLDRAAAATATAESTDRQGVRHRLWVLEDESEIELISRTLADRQIVIADGHHRYETSLAYRNEIRADTVEEQPCDYVMMTMVNVYSPGVIVFPTHRMARNLPAETVAGLDALLSARFDVLPSSKGTLAADMAAHGGRAIGLYGPGRVRIAVPKPEALASIDGPAALGELDVSVLHDLILDKTLGIDAVRIREEANVAYTRDEEEAMAAVDGGDFQLAFFLNPIKLETILEVAKSGARMPQKATYFYPKLLSGLVMRKIEW